MKRSAGLSVVVLIVTALFSYSVMPPSLHAQTTEPASALKSAPTSTPTSRPSNVMEPADAPSIKRLKDGSVDTHFTAHHEANLKRAADGPVGLLFLGDSITQRWTAAPDVWREHYGKYNPANFGVDGDRTQHVLWRIEEGGELDHVAPKVVVLLIGTNNGGWPRPAIIRAITRIVGDIHRKLPETKVLLLGIFPRGADPKDSHTIGLRAHIDETNAGIAKLDDGMKTRYLYIGDKFLEPDGSISVDVMSDGLHPTPKGYKIWSDAMQPTLDEMLEK